MKEILERAEHYRLRAHRKARAHYLAAKSSHAQHLRLGVPVVLSTTIVGTTIFATLRSKPDTGWMVATGLLSITAAVLAGLQTFFRHAESAEKHRTTAASYAALFRKFDLYLLKYHHDASPDTNKALDELTALVDVWNHLEANGPDVADVLYDKAVAEDKADKEGV